MLFLHYNLKNHTIRKMIIMYKITIDQVRHTDSRQCVKSICVFVYKGTALMEVVE